jgi:signal transduction histidine kinase/CheY-like chemotaxis protein
MKLPILTVTIAFSQDVMTARQRAREIAALLGFDIHHQTRLVTAVSEMVRNAFQYAGGGEVAFSLEGSTAPQRLLVVVRDHGPGIADVNRVLEQEATSKAGTGLGIPGARRLVDTFEIESSPGRGTRVFLRKVLHRQAAFFGPAEAAALVQELTSRQPRNLLEELRQQNADLLRTLEELHKRQEELARVNRELEDTNRGVVALYAELDERADHLRRADEVKTRFLSNMTHEFRTPLHSIQALAGILLGRTAGDLTAEQERQIQFIRKAAEALSELVNDLLDLAKVSAGKVVVRVEEFEVKNLFSALRGMLRPLLLNTKVNLVFEEQEALPPLHTDQAKVSQILRNFISNGLKYTENGEVRVSARRAGDAIVFSVADTGIGIAEEDIETIFQEFTQVEHPLQGKVKGTGLGLPLAKRLAELLGGSVHAESRPGVGSTFTATIPLAYDEPAPAGALPPPRRLNPARMTVLLAGGDVEARLFYEKCLHGTPFRGIAARSMEEAQSLLDSLHPAAILLDLYQPEGNSPESARWARFEPWRAEARSRGTPLIVISRAEDREQALWLGAAGFGERPVGREWLLQQLEALLEGQKTRTVLLIDDDEMSRYLLRRLFFAGGARVLEARDGMEGLQIARKEQPRVIVLDLRMPEVNGLTVLEQLKADPLTSQIPVLVSTSGVLSEADRARLEQWRTKLLPKSTLSDGTAGEALRRLSAELGLSDLWGSEEIARE